MFEIELDKKDKAKLFKAIDRLVRRVEFWKEEVPRQASVEYTLLVISDILSGKRYTKYAVRYAKWKKEKYPGSPTWLLSGAMLDVLRTVGSHRIKGTKNVSTYYGGIMPGIHGASGTNYGETSPAKEILWYATIAEYGNEGLGSLGGQRHPARPLFRPAYRKYIPQFRKKLTQVKRDIRGAWK
jgi:hypothetical protein